MADDGVADHSGARGLGSQLLQAGRLGAQRRAARTTAESNGTGRLIGPMARTGSRRRGPVRDRRVVSCFWKVQGAPWPISG